MGVITSNRGASRGGIFSNILELNSNVFIARNICSQILGNVLSERGILNNEAIAITYNRASRISGNTTRYVTNNTVNNVISNNTTPWSKGIAYNIIAGALSANQTTSNIIGNISNSISDNGPLVGAISGNVIDGVILENNNEGDIIGNYTGDIKNNY